MNIAEVIYTIKDRIENVSDDEGTPGKTIQYYAGNSTNNNRQPSVAQVIRYFTSPNAPKRQRETGNALKVVYDLNRSDIRRLRPNNRSDAVDINEFIRFFEG